MTTCKKGLHRSTVFRHRKAAGRTMPAVPPGDDQPWGAWIRERYELDRNELELVSLAEMSLSVANDPAVRPAERLQAASRFHALVRQLKLEDADRG